MAKIFRRPGSKHYYYRIFKDGKDVWKSTGKTDRKEAQAVADGHRSALVGMLNTEELFTMLIAKLEALPKNDRERQRIDYGHRLLRLQEKELAFTKAWDCWLQLPNKSKFGNLSKNTLAGYSAIWKRLKKWSVEQNITYLHEMTQTQGEIYMGTLMASGVTERTFGAHLKFLKSFFRTIKNQAGIIENPFEGNLVVPKLQTQSREAFSREELKIICEKATGDWRYMVGIGIFTGLRLTDVAHLRWENMTDVITVTPQKVKRRKTGKRGEIKIPLHRMLAILVDELKAKRGDNPTGFLFPAMVAAYAKSRQSVSQAFCDFLKDECGIVTTAGKDEDSPRKRRASVKGFHSLRHSFVSMCGASGVPQHTAQMLVGHANAAMTQSYSHSTAAQALEAINLLPSDFMDLTKPITKNIAKKK